MQLSLYISNLLFDHDCVTVPGFGSFLGNYKSAEYDLKEQKFYPPTKQISFNSVTKTGDSPKDSFKWLTWLLGIKVILPS